MTYRRAPGQTKIEIREYLKGHPYADAREISQGLVPPLVYTSIYPYLHQLGVATNPADRPGYPGNHDRRTDVAVADDLPMPRQVIMAAANMAGGTINGDQIAGLLLPSGLRSRKEGWAIYQDFEGYGVLVKVKPI